MQRDQKPSTLHLPKPDQAISSRWLIQRIRQTMVDTKRLKISARRFWNGYNEGLLDLANAIQRKARSQAAVAFAKAKRSKRK